MAQTEDVLLERFATTGDTAALSQIIRAHAGLVYGVCLRILADRDKAADATQETFLQLLRKARTIKGSTPGWLHSVAACRATDMIRRDSARRRTEARYADQQPRQATSWQDLSAYVDQALVELDDDTRDFLIQYFFEAHSMTDIAAAKGISHATVSRRVEAGVTRLRESLHKKGVVIAAAALTSLLTENAAQALPAAVAAELAKISLVGHAFGGFASSMTTNTVTVLAATAKTKLVIAAAVAAVAITGALVYQSVNHPSESAQSQLSSDTFPDSVRSTSTSSQPQPPGQSQPQQEPSQAQTTAPPSTQPARKDQTVQTNAPESTNTQQRVPERKEPDKIDLSSPESAARSFVKMFVAGDAEAVLSCFLPGGVDYLDIKKILDAGPDDPDYEMKLWLQSLDPDAEMPIVSKEQTPAGTKVVWMVTIKKDFAHKNVSFQAGTQMELDATLVERDGKWLIDNF